MKSVHRSNSAFGISVVFHLLACILGYYFWVPSSQEDLIDQIEGVVMEAPKQRTKRIIPPKRVQLQRREVTTPTNQTNVKILTSNVPLTDRGVVTAAKATRFDMSKTLRLDEHIGLENSSINIPEQLPSVKQSVPINSKQNETNERPKSRLVKFIERQTGAQRIVYMIDLSSSMLNLSPLRLSKIRLILRDSLDFLEAQDQFNLLTFGEDIDIWRTNFLPVNKSNISQAIEVLENAQPKKTSLSSDQDMLNALSEISSKQPTIVVLFSDGILTSAGIPDFAKIRSQVPIGTKIFAMGTDMSTDFPGAVIMRNLAEQSGGEFWLVEGN